MENNYKVGDYYLDNNQMQLLLNNDNNIVIAGAGAGKTLTIMGKINYLIENKLTTPEKIIVISFTNASVNDIKAKIKYAVNVSTFHKLAMNILAKASYEYSICPSNYLHYIIDETLRTCSLNIQKDILKFLNINQKYDKFLKSQDYNSFCNFIETFINLWKTNNYNFSNINLKKFTKLEKRILMLIFNIYKKYIEEKNGIQSLDFDDLILKATDIIKRTKIECDYIIIDEFQDTSFIRLNLIKELVKYTFAKVIVVGDDWQSIYRFSGCDLNIFLNFTTLFNNVQTIKLENTYRNSQELINIAAKFISKNPLQIQKSLKSSKHTDNPLIFVPYTETVATLKRLLDYLLLKTDNIMIISRNNKDIFNYIDNDIIKYQDNKVIYKDYQIKYLTIHRSKGLEAEYVILLNCNDNLLGIPNRIENNNLIKKVFVEKEMPYAEERRLYYVAITRCKEKTFLLYNKDTPSPFILETKKIIKKFHKKITYF